MMVQTYTTQAGDNLSKIAQKYGVSLADISGYRSGDPNKIGVGEILNINSKPIPAANTANAADLAARPYTAPLPAPAIIPSGIPGLVAETQNRITALQPSVDQGKKDIQGVYEKLAGSERNRQALYDSEGVNTARKELNDINNEIRTKELYYRRQSEGIMANNPTGRLEAGQNIALADLDRKKNSELADLAIIAEAKQGNYSTAKSIVDAKVDAETADLKTKLQGISYFYEQNYDQLTDAQKTLLQERTAQVEQDIQEKQDLVKVKGDVQIEAAKNGAPVAVLQAIGAAADQSAAISAAGKYIGLYDRMNTISSINARNLLAENGGFSNSQVADGAANAGVPIETFKTYDTTTKNMFINGNISGAKTSIDAAFEDGGSVSDVIEGINGMQGLTPTVQQYLTTYANTKSKDYAPPSPEETTQTLVESLTGLQTQGYTRKEAESSIRSVLTDDGKTAIPLSLNNSITDALNKTYGKSGFWNWLTGQAGKKE